MEQTSATIRPAITFTILSSRSCPDADGSAMISRSRRMMTRSAGSLGGIRPSHPCSASYNAVASTLLAASRLVPRGGRRPGLIHLAGRGCLPARPAEAVRAGAMKSVFAPLVQTVQGTHRQLGIGRVDQHAD